MGKTGSINVGGKIAARAGRTMFDLRDTNPPRALPDGCNRRVVVVWGGPRTAILAGSLVSWAWGKRDEKAWWEG